MTIGLGSVPQQDVFQRVMSARNVRASIISCYIAGGMYLSIAALPLIISYCGKMLYPELAEGDTQMMIPRMVLQHSGLGIQILFFGALISAILSTCSGAMLAPATVIGENLIRPVRKNMSDAELLQVMRFSVIGVGVISGCMALMRNNIYELVGESSAFSLVSLFVPLISGLYWKRASSLGATLSMLLGISVWAATNFTLPDLAASGTLKGAAQFWAEFPPMLYGLAASAGGMLAGSLIRPGRPAITTA
jgi:Na+/proline symporter